MGDGLRCVRVLGADGSLLATAKAAVKALGGYEFDAPKSLDELIARPPVAGDVILLDAKLREPNVYEACRTLVGKTRCRTFVVVDADNRYANGIAHFCGATGTIEKPLSVAALRKALEQGAGPRPELPQAARKVETKPVLPEQLLRDLAGAADHELVVALSDPETNLFSYAFIAFKLDEEFKRAQRFGQPLSCVMLGFEGEAAERTLRELSGIFLSASRDTDVLGRFDINTFLFLLPSTGTDGAQIMAQRVKDEARKAGLRDLVGDPLELAVGIACHPHAQIRRREDLFARARSAYADAQKAGGGVVTSA
jgi:GGDEF domain-containing protein